MPSPPKKSLAPGAGVGGAAAAGHLAASRFHRQPGAAALQGGAAAGAAGAAPSSRGALDNMGGGTRPTHVNGIAPTFVQRPAYPLVRCDVVGKW